jgi:hypothetical protein
MIYRAAVLSTILMAAGMGFTIPAYAEAWTVKGKCTKANIAESDGVQTGVANGMSGKDYLALMQRARAAHLTLGSDGFLWATQPVQCDSAIVWVKANSKGDTLVSFSNGDQGKPVLGFTGVPTDGDGPLFFSDSVYLGDGKPAMPLNPNGNGQSCHFYFTDHGTFTQGWENRLTTIECNVRVKGGDGHLVSVDVRFDRAQTPGGTTVDKGSSPSPKAAPDGSAEPPNAQGSQTGLEWMKSAPAFCQSKPYSSLTPEQRAPCEEAAFRNLSKNWRDVTASNGQVYEVALDTIYRNLPSNMDSGATLRAVTVIVYESQGELFNPNNVRHFYFDCRDHFQTFQQEWSPVAYFPPLSVVAKIASIACDKSEPEANVGTQATPPETPSYDPIPEGWNIKIGLPGTLSVGAEYCTQSGNCQYVGEGNVGLIQACQETPDAESCLKARVPVQVLASSPNGSVIVRLNGRNYGVSGVQWEHREPDGSSIGGPVSVIYQGASIPLRLGWQPGR